MNLEQEYINKKNLHTEIFKQTKIALDKELEKVNFSVNCKECTKYSSCNFIKENPFYYKDILVKIPENCLLSEWKKICLNKIETDISKDIIEKITEINLYKNNFHCQKCGTCCTLACSEFSYEELKEKAKNGDKFATDFTSIFVPYKTKEEAYKIYPEYFELVEKKFKDEKIYFYYCPKYDKNTKLCSDYENRPNVCRIFPSEALCLLPKSCGYNEWKQSVEIDAIMLYTLINILDFYKEKLKKELLI